jgi:hypothetical protein
MDDDWAYPGEEEEDEMEDYMKWDWEEEDDFDPWGGDEEEE